MNKLHVAAFVAAAFAVSGIAPSFADGSGPVNAAAAKATTASGTATQATSGIQVAEAMMQFGTPPSGEVPILFNDHHVYAKPDVLRQGRVLAALVRGGTILVPLRSMFEQMGATVSFDPGSKAVTARKEGAEVRVTNGKNEVIINGESRPLDVPPMMYKGQLLVPVRVMSEALGAYVQWVPEQRVVVVRYQPATPAPAPVPSTAPTAVPTASPTPVPTVRPYLGYLQGGVAFGGKIYNEFSAGEKEQTGFGNGGSNGGGSGLKGSFVASGAYRFDPFAVKVDLRQDQYVTTNTGLIGFPDTNGTAALAANPGAPITCFSTIDTDLTTGSPGYTCTPQFTARQSTLDGRLLYKVTAPNVYIGVGYLQASNNYGYPQLRGVGAGLEKLPDFDANQTFSIYGSAFYYPNVNGTYTVSDPTSGSFGQSFKQEYRIVKYDIGATLGLGSTFYVFGGYSGDRYTTKQFAPINQTHAGPYAGLGFHF
ncbi:MAG: copper amine oxidase N-terminal domain-containing protein [Candidatus Eremiobacteraeota bacterium]|nr:copper amine oxidase N-terminal domain-containing protein [Candidatus Eremiobacteraeota bacterium]